MSYNVDELFSFRRDDDGYAVLDYLKKDDPTVTELEIPAEYNGLPVVSICSSAFEFSQHLKSVKLPKSLRTIHICAFWLCPELERVEFQSSPIIEKSIFSGCPKIPPEMIVMERVGSTDITRPILIAEPIPEIPWYNPNPDVHPDCFRPDVFELLLKNDCFRNCNLLDLLKQMIRENKPGLFPVAEQYGMFGNLENAELLDELIGYSAKKQTTEITAYLLYLKNRKFGFGEGDKF